jgi:PhzF family phenazine biosynthesis protein
MRFSQVDVFSDTPHRGNPVAVVHGADDLDGEAMAAFARWTNLSETTFLLRPTLAGADYRLRIFTPGGELPFAGHPTLGSCHAWLEAGGQPAREAVLIQECGVGLVTIRRDDAGLAFAAPPLRRTGALPPELLGRIRSGLGLAPGDIVDHQWVDNGPGWCAVLLRDAGRVLALKPDFAALEGIALGVVGPHDPARDSDFEVRAFVPSLGVPEDPVTGSLNAGIAQWLIGAGIAPDRYRASQGGALGRHGRIRVERAGGEIWIGGATVTCIEGTVRFPAPGETPGKRSMHRQSMNRS